jgi:hypothetical protein
MSARVGTDLALALVVTVTGLALPPASSADEARPAPVVVPLVNPIGEKTAGHPHGLFRRVATARGFEIDDSRAGFHDVKAVGITNTFTPDTPAIYVVVEFLQSAFDIFRLVGRFILEDPEGKPVGTVLHVDRAQFENEDMGGYLMMTKPPGGFPVGNYRVEIHYENVTDMSLLTLARFKVVPPTGAAPTSKP